MLGRFLWLHGWKGNRDLTSSLHMCSFVYISDHSVISWLVNLPPPNALLSPYFRGGYVRGGRLTSHDHRHWAVSNFWILVFVYPKMPNPPKLRMADPRRRSKRRLRILFKVSWIQRKGQKRGPPLPECHPVKNERHHVMKAWDFFGGWGIYLKAFNIYLWWTVSVIT